MVANGLWLAPAKRRLCSNKQAPGIADEGTPEVSYWLGRDYWGQGIATWALKEFLAFHNQTRPIYARVAKDNLRSRRVLEKCGFTVIDETTGFANARGAEIVELLLELPR
jgi:RimJ/RimL family protein N-acetyltransferase